MKTYVTFGQAHVHNINGVIFDKDCVAVVEGGREKSLRYLDQNSASSIQSLIGMIQICHSFHVDT